MLVGAGDKCMDFRDLVMNWILGQGEEELRIIPKFLTYVGLGKASIWFFL